MRALLTGERAKATATGYSRWLKLEVQNGSGTWKNVGDLLGVDYVVGGGWGEDRDQPVARASFRISRGTGTKKLSPLVVGSLLNVDDGGFYSPLLEKGRAFRASSATIPNGTVPITSDWREGIIGRIDTVAWESSPIVIECSDLGAWLQDTQIKIDGVQYGTSPVGTAYETVMQNLVNAAHSGKLTTAQETVYKTSTKSFAVTNWQPGRPKVLEGLRALALNTTADDVRFRYDASHVSRLTITDPQRDRTTIDATFGPTEYYAVKRIQTALADIRNSGKLPYTTDAGVAGSVTSPADLTTDPSILDYGERYFELPESDAIITEAQAQTLLDLAVHDLNDAPLDHEYELPMAWFVQLYDRYTFSANQVHYDEDQIGVVMRYAHDFDGLGKARTTIGVAGKVIGAYADWRRGIKAGRTTVEAYNQVLAKVTASDATTVTVTVTATSPTGTPSVQYVGVTAGATKLSGPAAGVASASGTVWVFTRGAAGGGIGQAQFRATFPGNVDDDDFVTIPAQGDTSTVYLQARARVIASDATTVSVRLAVANPSPGATATISYTSLGVTSVSPASGGTVTPAGTLTEAAGTFIDYVITKPAFGAGTGRVTFTASSAGYVPDSDSVDVPAVQEDTVTPVLSVVPGTPTATQIPYTVSAINPKTGTALSTLTVELINTTSAGGGNPPGVYTVANGSVIVMDRPPFDTVTQAAIRVTASIAGGGSATLALPIANQVKTLFGPSLTVTPTESATSTSVAYTSDGTLSLTIDGVPSSVPASPFTVTRPNAGALALMYAFSCVKDGETIGIVVAVNPKATAGASSAWSGISLVPDTNAQYTGIGTSNLRAVWTYSSAPSGTTYDIRVEEETTVNNFVGELIQGVTSPYVWTGSNIYKSTGGSTKRVRLTVFAINGGGVIATSQTYEHAWNVF
jgi:hypothetical protein